MQYLYLRLRRDNPMTKKDVAIATQKLDIPGYSSTNKRVYRKLYAILYKSSQKFCFKMFRHPIQGRPGNVVIN